MGSPVDVFLSLRVIGLWHQPISMRIMAMNKKNTVRMQHPVRDVWMTVVERQHFRHLSVKW